MFHKYTQLKKKQKLDYVLNIKFYLEKGTLLTLS